MAHSLSPLMQNAAFAARGLDWVYVACDVEPDGLAEAVRGLPALGFAGANVTAPHKLAAARLVGADVPSVNTIVFRDGRAEGFSTDAAILDRLAATRPAIVGDGGSASAFAQALPGARQFARRGAWPPDVADADVVVNATSARDEVLVELRAGQTLVELPYPDSATAVAARAAGATVIGGLDVLVAQGAAAFELWTGVSAPVEVMRAAVGLPDGPRAP
ncbi:MAG: shikimate dehydrogenase [Gaiellaceae bacterium]|nr:shikimate dehydrogenase [Gaiellaceae bacterium]